MTMDAGNDILIRLYGAEDHAADFAALRERGIAIKLAMDVNASEIEAFVRDNFSAISIVNCPPCEMSHILG